MKRSALLLALLLAFSGCTSRSVPVSAPIHEESSTEESSLQPDLSPLSESSIGQALLGCVREVNSVTVTSVSDGEVVYESADDVLSQSFYDALQIVDKKLEAVEDVQYDYQVLFHTELGLMKSYNIRVKLQQSDIVIVENEEGIWTLPQSESDWLRSRLVGLA